MTEENNKRLKELNQFYQTDIELLINGAKVKRREEPNNIKTLKDELRQVLSVLFRSSKESPRMGMSQNMIGHYSEHASSLLSEICWTTSITNTKTV
jgi:hypothetical protein